MWKKIVITSLVALGAVSCAYNRPVERDTRARTEREAPAEPRARPMGEGEMETPGIDSPSNDAPAIPRTPNTSDMPVAPDSGSDEPAPGSTVSPSASDDDILSPADDNDVMTPGEAPMPPDAIAPTPSDTDASDESGAADDGVDDGTTPNTNKKKKAPGRGEGEGESDAEDDTNAEDEENDEALPGDAEIDQ